MSGIRPKTGDTAPELNLFDSSGNTFELREKTGNNRNTMLLFYRGHW